MTSRKYVDGSFCDRSQDSYGENEHESEEPRDRFWESKFQKEFSSRDCYLIRRNLIGFVEVLLEWEKNKRAGSMNEQAELAKNHV